MSKEGEIAMIAKSISMLWRLFLCLVWGAATTSLLVKPGSVRAEVALLTVSEDTFINNGLPNNNAGKTGWFSVGEDGTGGVRRGLFRFDLTSIPPGSTITSATVQLTLTRVPGGSSVNSTFDLFRLLAGWGEGIKSSNNGSNAGAGEATWNARLRGTEDWTTPGAEDDAVETVSASAVVGTVRNAKYTWSGPGLVANVQF